MTARRDAEGTASLNNSTHFCLIPGTMVVSPVTFPPGRARLDTPHTDRIGHERHDDGNSRRGLLRGPRFPDGRRDDDVYVSSHEITGELAEAFGAARRGGALDDEVASLDVVQLAHRIDERYPKV